MNATPARIGRYVVERELGSGGMGEVYLAYSPAGDPVAVKLIRGDRLDPVTRARFEKEALIARTVVGTNRVARFLDADPYADRPWLAMEYAPGDTLFVHVEAHGPLPAPLVASLGALLAEGLEAVHATGLLHRDLKPQNVIMGDYGPLLIDFGLGAFLDAAKDTLSHSGMIIGTVRCMPPEQAMGRPQVTPAADVYGLGTILLYAATGHFPYEGGRWEAIVGRVANPLDCPDLAGLPAVLDPLVSSMLAHEPTDRPSLKAVTATCAKLMHDDGLSPVRARQALIDRTAPNLSATAAPPPPSVILDQIEATAGPLIGEGLDSPLDAPHEASDAAWENEVSSVVEQAAVAPPARVRGGRVPASQRVAEELRNQYKTQPGL
ncbi:serine/threonine protein kinase [Actinoalloteichus sp. AHMU CJ021]|uniref:Serine/threonine protein kinase n=1 Tax=Actinoalloteichus caeruleus DSM 43889 TaxID=1120930 RepID=A0ABT1JDI0_ACTCY|nr:serine/threonine-protein kinase [Actinoalloteichus caeruleus]AUS81160.1 serine/threonine protein kinase [Actinoalloteichus sp. AHMU CJ021]MCP2330555.1 Serine/threonine protein kinase [Actinoalloteichus caeruleus DSM 43889]